jgi:hypothetical protein
LHRGHHFRCDANSCGTAIASSFTFAFAFLGDFFCFFDKFFFPLYFLDSRFNRAGRAPFTPAGPPPIKIKS